MDDREAECFLCVKERIDPPAHGVKWTGQRWSEYHERWIVFRGHLCEMHLDTTRNERRA